MLSLSKTSTEKNLDSRNNVAQISNYAEKSSLHHRKLICFYAPIHRSTIHLLININQSMSICYGTGGYRYSRIEFPLPVQRNVLLVTPAGTGSFYSFTGANFFYGIQSDHKTSYTVQFSRIPGIPSTSVYATRTT